MLVWTLYEVFFLLLIHFKHSYLLSTLHSPQTLLTKPLMFIRLIQYRLNSKL